MTFRDLAQRIQRATGVDAAGIYEVFRSEHGTSDLHTFLVYLRDEEILTESLFAELAAEIPEASPAEEAPTQARDEPRYERHGRLGAGAMGEVFEARDRSLRRKVALKSLKGQPTPAQRDRFVKEVRVTAQLDHPGVVPVYSLEDGDTDEVAYAMKLVRGKELAQLIADKRQRLEAGASLEPEHRRERFLELLRRVCEAVAFAHSRGVVHRDLKPANIMVGRFGEVYLMDWGIARVRRLDGETTAIDADTTSFDATRPGAILGTPLYMSPEQAEGDGEAVDGRSDQYALGLILQEMLTLRPPRAGADLRDVLDRAKKGERTPIEPYPGDTPIPRELRAIVAMATHPVPEERYADVEAFAADLERFLRGDEVQAAPDNVWQRAARQLARHRRAALGTLVVLLAVSVAAVVTVSAVVQEKRVIEGAHARERALERLVDDATSDARALDLELLRHELAVERLVGATAALSPKLPDTDATALTSKLRGAITSAGARDSKRSPGPRLDAQRIYVTLPSGASLALHGTAPTDVRDTAGYRAAVASKEPVWLTQQASGGAQLICAAAVRDTNDALLGVVGLELTLDEARGLLVRDGSPWADAVVLDGSGAVVVRTQTGDTRPPEAAVVEAVRSGRRGLVELPGTTVAIAPIDASGWAFVATLHDAPNAP